jgi:hypothetical protein
MTVAKFFRNLFRGNPPSTPAAEESRPAPPEGDTVVRLTRALITLTTEVWRARSRLEKLTPAERAPLRVVQSSIDKMSAALESLGVRVDDPTGRTWDERDPVKVLVFEAAEGVTRAQVTEVVKPTLYLGESLLAAGEVVVAVPKGDERAQGGG